MSRRKWKHVLRDSTSPNSVRTLSEREAALSKTARAIFQQSLLDCSIERAFTERVNVQESGQSPQVFIGEHCINLSLLKHVRIVAAGKAARRMLVALLNRLPLLAEFDLRGVLIAPDAPELSPGIEFYAGGHPFPNQASFAGARAVLDQLRSLPADAGADNSLCLFLISGGASAMMELPLDPSISLEDTVAFHSALVHSGASIFDINCVRKHFSAVKGGRLAGAAGQARCVTILLSDVPAGHLGTIASGPTVPDKSTVAECHEILDRFRLNKQFPSSVQKFFTSERLVETVKPDEMKAETFTILNADDFAEAARENAEKLGFPAIIDNTCDDWDYREAAHYLLQRMRDLCRERRPACLISVGEIIVRPGDDDQERAIANGNGGRNQHFALYAATLLNGDLPIAIFSAGSDGIDGHSDAAGAVVGSQMLSESRLAGEDGAELRTAAIEALAEFQSSTFLSRLGATIVTGPTGNNLRDLRILLVD